MIYQRTLKDLRQLMGQQAPYGPTELGTNLRSRILEPLVYQPLRTNSLRRPVLVSIITDGCPQGPREKLETLKQAILECGRLLEAAGYERTVVRFQISQIGTDEDAKAFLKSLMREDQLQDVLYCTTGSLDEKFAKFRDNETRLEQWLLRLLMSPITNADQS
ncbi:Ankyrin repeat-containing domain [Trichophyton rubrum]|nr:Ankyrin repeat-containing domain [Trichophyton rubrum]